MTLYGIPRELADSDALRNFVLKQLPAAASSVPEMGITPDVVTTYVPGDLLSKGLGEEVILFVEGLFMRKERTAEVRQRFAEAVRDCVVEFVREHVPNCTMVEIIPRSQRPDDGFADWCRDD
jgi:hypothetical protein